MTPEEFRKAGYRAVDWIASFFENIREYPVFPRVKPGELADALPPVAPEDPEPIADILTDFEKLIVPANTHWNHPNFFGFFSISSTPPGVLAEMLTAALNVNHMLWRSSPAGTELEQVTLAWLRDWLGFPKDLFGIIYDTASISTLHAIVAAREMADPEARDRGANGNLVLYTSEQAHSSVEKSAIAVGIGRDNVRLIGVDEQFRMRPDLLLNAIRADKNAGKHPFCVVATIGTTAVTAVDPVPAIAEIAAQHRMWLHVDAAYAGPAALLDSHKHHFAGIERTDSIVVNPHKWMFTPVDLSVFYTRHPEILKRAFSLVPSYLKTDDDPRALNFMDYGVQLGRRFRSLKLWFVMRAYGRRQIAGMIAHHCELAREFASWVEADGRFESAAPVTFSLVCFRHRGGNEATARLITGITASGGAFVGGAMIGGRHTIRLAIGNFQTTREDLVTVWEYFRANA